MASLSKRNRRRPAARPEDPTTSLVLRFSRQKGETPAKIAEIIEGL